MSAAPEAAAAGAAAHDLLGAASWRITRGRPTPEELAALAVVLTARLRRNGEAAAAPGAAAGLRAPRGAPWGRREERRPARAWSARARPGWRSAA
ncbi:acyl-CoA carboxylase epsilon subunit [Streptomyces sp. JJ36]|uniref:acyl-CoA carboxylase epsilon subunit n=1 Tax=Streptomyces sp. JJ36 TaxID=2736645 RepID=UPI001F1C2920|nr:acyl-CoA carboxylase epsilon subunit [Streptomyces sp. JJ36]MCF6525445.1 hypothetical protein [Streptomyces sp. JJ36]